MVGLVGESATKNATVLLTEHHDQVAARKRQLAYTVVGIAASPLSAPTACSANEYLSSLPTTNEAEESSATAVCSSVARQAHASILPLPDKTDQHCSQPSLPLVGVHSARANDIISRALLMGLLPELGTLRTFVRYVIRYKAILSDFHQLTMLDTAARYHERRGEGRGDLLGTAVFL